MENKDINYYYNKFKFGEDIYHQLMQHRVKEILLVASFYDAYIFEQDGRLSEQILGEYRALNLSTEPRITSVPTREEAIDKIKANQYDLVITMMRVGETIPYELCNEIKSINPSVSVLLLLNNAYDIALLNRYPDKVASFDDVFLWSGDSKLFLAMIKYVEDLKNLDADTQNGLVRVILLVEDSINYYSSFLPILYQAVMEQTHKLIQEEVNDLNKRLRMRSRPKVVLVHDYEKAVDYFNKYKEFIVCVISDVSYPRGGKIDEEAGLKLQHYIKEQKRDLPILVQSSEESHRYICEANQVSFVSKNSKSLLVDLSNFIKDNLGFGDFYFRDSSHQYYATARSFIEFESCLETIPDSSLLYHSKQNHFSAWMIAHGEYQVAKKIQPMQVDEFSSVEELRQFLQSIFREVRMMKARGKIIDFNPHNLAEVDQVIRLAEGSLGGKGRGLAFLNALLTSMELEAQFPGVNITLPSTAIIGTSEYDRFIQYNGIEQSIAELTDAEIEAAFLSGNLSQELNSKLAVYIDKVTYPIAVRSSGLLEDSQAQPFAGIYRTFMLPNNHPQKEVRLQQLQDAIKLVYSSVYLRAAREYIEGVNYNTEEEKMAVILQELVGTRHGEYFYPHMSGVAQSYNFYPTSYLEHEDGVAILALGLGKAVVEGEKTFRFCPSYPRMDILTPSEMLSNTQQQFYALKLHCCEYDLRLGEGVTLEKLDLKEADEHGILQHLVSVWDASNSRVDDGYSKVGRKLLTFADILKYDYFPLAAILKAVLDIGATAMGVPVEIEFAVSLESDPIKSNFPSFYILQIRPLTLNVEEVNIDPISIDKEQLILYSDKAMGNGIVDTCYDIIYVDPDRFDKTQTIRMQQELAELNERLHQEDRNYILIGPGRWGSRDRFLGIPVQWHQISMARIIVEVSLPNFVIDPSQGTHFFHNLIAMNIGYFNIAHNSEGDILAWDWLKSAPKLYEGYYLRQIRLPQPLIVKMDGKQGIAIIEKPLLSLTEQEG